MQQPALQQLGQPRAVFRVGLVPLDGLDVRRVDHDDLGEVLLAQRVIHRLGVHPAGLHRHVRHAPAAQFTGHLLENTVKRPELEDLGLAGPRLLPWGPDRDLDHVLVHVDPGDALMQHLHALPPPERQIPVRTRTSVPPVRAPVRNQETDTRSRRGSGGYPARGSGANLIDGHERSIGGRPRRTARITRMHLPARRSGQRRRNTPARRWPAGRPQRKGPSFHPPRQSTEGAHGNLIVRTAVGAHVDLRRSAQRFERDTYHGDALPTELTGPVFRFLTWAFTPPGHLLGSCTAVVRVESSNLTETAAPARQRWRA